ncbi:MAG: hypothetical protein KDC54_05940 [Lewinella sp.]|nr:hypothetical protein [Lewinella sp.]
MIDKLMRTLQEVTEGVKQQAGQFGADAKEKTSQIIEDWLRIFPKLDAIGLKIYSFGLGVALSPSLEVELVGKHEDFSPGHLEALLEQYKEDRAMRTVLSTISTTYKMHRRVEAELREPLIVKVRIKLSPEVKVFIGEPIIQ